MAALAACSDGAGARTERRELDHRDEAVAVGAVPLLRARLLRRAERGERAPFVGGEADGDAGRIVVEAGIDRRVDALEAVDRAPWHAPAAEIALEVVETGREGLELLLRAQRLHVAEEVAVVVPV